MQTETVLLEEKSTLKEMTDVSKRQESNQALRYDWNAGMRFDRIF